MNINIEEQTRFEDNCLEIADFLQGYCVSDVSGTIEYDLSSYQCPYCSKKVALMMDEYKDDLSIITCNFCSGIFKLGGWHELYFSPESNSDETIGWN